jgi:hypothetical protein
VDSELEFRRIDQAGGKPIASGQPSSNVGILRRIVACLTKRNFLLDPEPERCRKNASQQEPVSSEPRASRTHFERLAPNLPRKNNGHSPFGSGERVPAANSI